MKKAMSIGAAVMLAACSGEAPDRLSGYVEAETLYMAPQEAGVVSVVAVREGDQVEAGDLLFRLEAERLSFAVEQAAAAAAAAEKRAEPSGALDQAVAEAQAELERVTLNFERTKKLNADGYVSKARYDNDRALVLEAEARLERARVERNAARHDLQSAEAQEGLTRRRLDDLDVRAPKAGTVERIYRRAGEVAGAGDPVVALLPPDNLKVRFFAPERMLSSLKTGGEIAISCDGCAAGLTARISYIATEPQFTPPVIYSLKEREKLVFLVEARPNETAGLRPGLPVDVTLP